MTSNGPEYQAGPQDPAVADPASGDSVPDTEQELREDIERTREQLGDTVEQFVAKADVKARTKAKAAELSGRVKDTASQAAQQVSQAAHQVQDTASHATEQVMARATGVRDQIADQTESLPDVPPNRVPVVVMAVVAVLAGFLLVRRLRK
jgi:gas vesicle protein